MPRVAASLAALISAHVGRPRPTSGPGGRDQRREGEVVHLVAERLEDLADLLRSAGGRDAALPTRHGRGDKARTDGGADRRGPGRARDIYIPDLRLGSGSKVPTRDFR